MEVFVFPSLGYEKRDFLLFKNFLGFYSLSYGFDYMFYGADAGRVFVDSTGEALTATKIWASEINSQDQVLNEECPDH
ncbi:hypothetical protein [Pseudozobellia sp. WGM2]|uniref:hypothetical protein n=1 Tax=Pseudozobellia sp. WGM2 TaxID=2787625 RepID=UPI001ADF0C05|nr:hypothetical protein [Pseudozobellia sp. WGM2]